ncbi:MAG: chromosome segregation DNA-binding protein [Parcubacteria group bacterium GW2011_GWD1_38_16]|nr:MAG: chromosome segregation DNA-binding protein [Parcubacteria group bacterium GW2011_GWD1_38_16]
MKYHGLGRGLGALISKKDNSTNEVFRDNFSDAKNGDAVFYIEIEKINPNPEQPRKEFNEDQLRNLSDSIREYGILQPLVVSKLEKISSSGIEVSYQLIAGERRLRAAKLSGLFQVPVIIRKTTPKENLELAIIENVQRSDLNAIERAVAYQKLIEEYNLTQQEVAARVGKSREAVANLLRLLNLSQEIKDAISSGKINEGHARAILMVKDQRGQMDLFYRILNMGLNVREVENIARTALARVKKIIEIDPNMKFMVSQIEDAVGAKVSVQPRAKGGRIIIEYYQSSDLENIVNKIYKNINSEI